MGKDLKEKLSKKEIELERARQEIKEMRERELKRKKQDENYNPHFDYFDETILKDKDLEMYLKIKNKEPMTSKEWEEYGEEFKKTTYKEEMKKGKSRYFFRAFLTDLLGSISITKEGKIIFYDDETLKKIRKL